MTKNSPNNMAGFRLAKVATALFAALVVFTLLVAPANAQLAGKGAIKGSVLDSTGAVIPGATIVVTNDSTGITTTTTSTSAGDFDISTLDPGIYTVTVTIAGFEKLTQKNIHINALESQTFNPQMTIGSSTDTVTVDAAPPQLETTNATLGATMEQDMYSALPIEMGAYGQPDQRRATDFAFLMPGVQGNNTNGNPTTNSGIVNGSGSRGAVSAVYIDGTPFVRAGGNGDPRFVWTAISVDAVEQFQVQTNGYSAMYEGQGVQNYTVKQGGKKFHGAVYEFFRNTALDTWGFFGANNINPVTGASIKPIEHSNEYGINLGGSLLPFTSWKDKLFFFGNYNGFRYASQTPTAITFPTLAQQSGNFQGLVANGIFDPNTQTQCTSLSNNGPCRYRYGQQAAGTVGPAGNPVSACPANPTGCLDIIPSSQFSQIALKLQSYLPQLTNQQAQNNYLASNRTGLTNWSTTNRIDFVISSKNTMSIVGAIGRQASSVPVGQTTAGRNVGPVPYNFGQAFAPKTAVGIIEDTHIFSPHIVNQIKYGYARYDGPSFNADQSAGYAATAMGLTNLPTGQAQGAFPIVTFSGTNPPTNWGGTTANRVVAENYTLLDSVQWNFGKHSLTVGAQIAWLLYQNTPATGGSIPLTLANSATETAQLNKSYAALSNSGLAYASFLIGQIDSEKYTQYAVLEYGSRFRAISPYIQDNWKVTNKLTLDFGVRFDYFPTMKEVVGSQSFFNPTLLNPVTGINGALQFAGNGANTCNCETPANNYFKNFGPRLGLAYQVDPKTVVRASYGVMFTHGNGVGGGAASVTGGASNSNGFSSSLSTSANSVLLSSSPLSGTNTAVAAAATPCGRASGPAFTTGFTTVTSYTTPGCGTASYTGTPPSVAYYDPYLGGRAPEYINWTLGFQHQWTNSFTSTITYVGSQGHFLPADGSNARGFWADQLDPQYLSLNTLLADSGVKAAADCVNNNLPCPANFTAGQNLAVELKPFPFHSVTDFFGNVANSNYHALQTTFNMRPTHGLTFMANYTWSRSIDDGGTFRSGYAIPAAYSNNGRSWAADRIERTISTSNQPQHIVLTAVWNLPFGKDILATQPWERAVFGGFKFSSIFQAFSGSPLAITGSSCPANPAQSTCMPSYATGFSPDYHARTYGKWGKGVTRTNYNTTGTTANQFIDVTAFAYAPAYTFGNLPRTAAYNIYGPGNYNLDISLRRSFGLRVREGTRLNLQADYYNVTNHTKFAVASTVFGNSSFGQVAPDPTATRRAVQLSGRIEF